MKVLLVNTIRLEANGISTFIINSAKILSSSGIKVTILAPNTVNFELKSDLEANGICIKEIPNRMHNPIGYYLRLKRELRTHQYDVIHINGNSTTMAIELLAASHANVRLRIAHSHNTNTNHPLINKLLRPIFESNINGRLACNTAAGQWLFNDKKYTVINNGIFLKKYLFNTDLRKKIRKQYNIANDDILIGHIGFFNFQKNQEFLVKLLKDMDSKFKLILIGDGSNFAEIKQQVINNKLSNRVIFTGVVNNVSDYLNAFDIFALPSVFEGQPFVVIEALASGLPVLVSKNISTEINLTNTVKFISLKDKNKWIDVLNNSSHERNKSRLKESASNIEKLKLKGYDAESNVIDALIPFYREYLR